MNKALFSETHPASDCRTIKLVVNRQAREATVAVYLSLADLLRDHLGLRGTKIACNQAACGACTVLFNGHAILACHTLAVQMQGANVETIEGASSKDILYSLQQAFIRHDALQCGFCTPGMIMAIKGAINTGVLPQRDAIAKAISGNICRCGAYQQIVEAVLDVIANG
jgi:xanthine dehydrogenase YagT iron-sulfur-binding subunit